jgi:tetratricopeptide (TPR) repeat protein
MAQIQNELGRLFTARREASKARQAHLAALALLEADATGPSAPPGVPFELARTYFFLGLRERPLPATAPRDRTGPEPIPDERQDSLAKAVSLLKTLSASPPTNPEYQHLLALCYLEGAVVEDDRRREARGRDERAIEILRGLVEAFPDIPDYAYDLSEAYVRMHLPDPPIPREVEDTVEERFRRALALLERLVIKHPDVPDYAASEARVHHKLGSFHRQMDRWDDAEQSFRKAIAVQAPLVRQFPDAPYYGLWLATFRLALADALIRRNQPGAARKELEETIGGVSLQLQQRPEMNSLHDVGDVHITERAADVADLVRERDQRRQH